MDQIPQPSNLVIDRKLGESGWEDTKTYTNTMYGYSIKYPGRYLTAVEFESPNTATMILNDLALTMGEKGTPFAFGQIQISVWIENPNLSFEGFKKSMALGRTFIGTTTIAGYDTIVFTENPPSDPSVLHTYCKDNRFAVLTKEDISFIIHTCTIDHERIWASFKFDK